MSWHYLQVEEEDFSLASYLDGIQSAQSKYERMLGKSSYKGREKEFLKTSQYGMMSEPLMVVRGRDELMSLAEDFPAKTLVVQGKELAFKEVAQDFGRSMQGLLEKLSLRLSLRKTPRFCGLVDLTLSSQTLPHWGTMLGGECWGLTTSASCIRENGCGSLLPTPSGVNGGVNHIAGRLDEWGGSSNPFRKTEIGSVHCPRFEEWMMGWPETWGALTGFEMDKYQLWLQMHGTFCQKAA